MSKIVEMFDDDREILSADDGIDGQLGYRVGLCGATKIEVYKEHGSLDFVPYIAVYIDDFLDTRIPAIGMTIHYKQPL